jgi:hypothetical protein
MELLPQFFRRRSERLVAVGHVCPAPRTGSAVATILIVIVITARSREPSIDAHRCNGSSLKKPPPVPVPCPIGISIVHY